MTLIKICYSRMIINEIKFQKSYSNLESDQWLVKEFYIAEQNKNSVMPNESIAEIQGSRIIRASFRN